MNNKYFTMLSLDEFCNYFNENLMMFFYELEESIENKGFEPTKYYIEKEDFGPESQIPKVIKNKK